LPEHNKFNGIMQLHYSGAVLLKVVTESRYW